MRQRTLDTEIVFRDLTRANKKLRHQHKNPDAVRRRFNAFVILTQKLTDTMRKEYQDLTSQKWEASVFKGWNPITELFKELRNTDLHKLPITINMVQIQVYHGFEIETDEFGNEKKRPVQAHIQLGYSAEACLKKRLPNPFGVEFIDNRIGQKETLTPSEYHFEFLIEGRTPEVEKLIEAVGTRDVHILTAQCFATLSDYYKFYQTQLTANRRV